MSVTTFATLNQAKGYPPLPERAAGGSSLVEWYYAVYHLPLDRFSVEDLGRAARQNIHRAHIVPLIFDRLKEDPLAGELYEGELMVALSNFYLDYWKANPGHATGMRTIIDGFGNDVPEEIQEPVEDILRMLARAQ